MTLKELASRVILLEKIPTDGLPLTLVDDFHKLSKFEGQFTVQKRHFAVKRTAGGELTPGEEKSTTAQGKRLEEKEKIDKWLQGTRFRISREKPRKVKVNSIRYRALTWNMSNEPATNLTPRKFVSLPTVCIVKRVKLVQTLISDGELSEVRTDLRRNKTRSQKKRSILLTTGNKKNMLTIVKTIQERDYEYSWTIQCVKD